MSLREQKREHARQKALRKILATPDYDEDLAIEIERIEASSFKKAFFERMEEINYGKYVEQEKFEHAEFMDLK